jgi:hypothetical protein
MSIVPYPSFYILLLIAIIRRSATTVGALSALPASFSGPLVAGFETAAAGFTTLGCDFTL